METLVLYLLFYRYKYYAVFIAALVWVCTKTLNKTLQQKALAYGTVDENMSNYFAKAVNWVSSQLDANGKLPASVLSMVTHGSGKDVMALVYKAIGSNKNVGANQSFHPATWGETKDTVASHHSISSVCH